MDNVDCMGSELRLIKFFIVIICLFEFFNMLLYYSRCVWSCNEKRLKMNEM